MPAYDANGCPIFECVHFVDHYIDAGHAHFHRCTFDGCILKLEDHHSTCFSKCVLVDVKLIGRCWPEAWQAQFRDGKGYLRMNN